MKPLAHILLTVFAFCLPVQAAERPNVVLIISDDQAWTDYGFMGNERVRTPHLDKLAAESVVFKHGYVPSPLCRPSLASMVTGLYPHQHGITGNDVRPARGLERHAEDRPFVERFHRNPSLVRTLVEHGYLAHQSGKWWEGSFRDGGFTHGMTHGDPERGGRHGDSGLKIGREGMAPVMEFIDHALAEDRPFFVWYAPFLPHTPHNPPADLVAHYQSIGLPESVARYYAMCEWFDQTCGELLEHLEHRGLKENTLIAYVCDNGWAARETATSDLPAEWHLDYAPRSKGSPFESGIRTPILLSRPGSIEAARSTELATSLDLMPTILTACGITLPENLPGIDLLDSSGRSGRDAIYGSSYAIQDMVAGDPSATLQYRWTIEGSWKLLVRHHGADTTRYRAVHDWDEVPVRLYNLKTDPHEAHNLWKEHPEVVERLATGLNRHIPSKNSPR